MPLVLSERPHDGQMVSGLELNLIEPGAAPQVAFDGKAAPELVELAPPFPVYTASPEHLKPGSFLKKAKITAWQYVVFDGDEPVAIAEARRVGFWRRLTITTRYPRSAAERLVEAVGRAEDEAGDREFQLRLLTVPDALLHAVWLHSPEKNRLLVISGPRSLEERGFITEQQLVAALQELADNSVGSTDESPKGLRRIRFIHR